MAYNGKHNDAKSLYYATQLLTYSEKSEARPMMRDGYLILWSIYDKQHKISLAYKYHLKYTDLNNRIENENYKAEISAWDAITKITGEEENYKAQLKITEERNNTRIELMNKEKYIQLYVFIAAIITGSALILFFVRTAKLKRRKEQLQFQMIKEQEVAELQQQKTELEMQALRAQLNPHFIFNCLNSINRFIIKNDAAKAADYLTKFAKLIRIVLEQSGKPFIPLEDELKCLQLYMDLEALRFEIPFQYEINCDGINTSSVMIPTLLIQPFIENAIWHGLQGKNHGNGKISVSMNVQDDILYCKICDNGIGRAATIIKEKTKTGKQSLGINLTEHRLQLIDPLKKERVGIEIHDLVNDAGHSEGTCVNIKIPSENNLM